MHSHTANQARKPISVRQPSSFPYFFRFLWVIFQQGRYADTAAQLNKRFARTAREAAQIRPTCPGPGGVCAEREQHCHRHQHAACHSSEQWESSSGCSGSRARYPAPAGTGRALRLPGLIKIRIQLRNRSDSDKVACTDVPCTVTQTDGRALPGETRPRSA